MSCSSHPNEIEKVYGERDNITRIFTGISVMRSRGQNIILFYTHKDKKINKYFFEDINDQYVFTNDSIEYTPDVLQLTGTKGSEQYKQELTSTIKTVLSKMDELNIRDIKSDLSDVGIDFQIYLKESKGIILYVSNPQRISSFYWTKYIKSMQKIDEQWRYTLTE